MTTRTLNGTPVHPIGLGCMNLSHAYGTPPSEAEAAALLEQALDLGYTHFDTATLYGFGANETLLGKVLRPHRSRIFLASKCGMAGVDGKRVIDGRPETLMRQADESLQRLQTDCIDLYYLHRVNRDVPVEAVAEVMGKLIREGLIRGWGMSQVGADTLAKAHAVTPVSAVQNLYNMLERDCEKEVFPFCRKNSIGVVPFSPVASGFLSGKITMQTDFSHADDVRKFVPQLRKENMEANQPVLDLLGQYASNKGATNAQIALAWMLHKYPNVVPIPGSKNQERILENLDAWNVELTDNEFTVLESALNAIPVHGHRGQVEYDGMSMKDWYR